MCLQPHRVYTLFRSFAARELIESLDDAFFVEVDRCSPTGLGHCEPFGHAVDRDHLVGAEKDCAAYRHLTYRPATPNGNRISRLKVALNGSLPTGRKDVTKKQHLLVC